MPWTYGEVALTPVNSQQVFAERYWHKHRIDEFEYQGYFVPHIQHLPGPYIPKRSEPRPGVLYWPTGANDFARCHLMATGEQLAELFKRGLLDASPHALTIDDGTVTVTTSMYLLPPRPVFQKGSGEWHLLTFVDERYFWWTAGAASAPSNPSSWSDLLNSLCEMVGVVPTIDSVPAAYLTPNATRWTVGIQPVPILIEAAARQIGMRVVRRLDGAVFIQRPDVALAADSARWNEIRYEVLAGGRMSGALQGLNAPAAAEVAFFDGNVEYVTLSSLSIPEYAGASGVSDRAARITADPATATAPERASLATQAASDYYKWNLSLTDVTLRGLYDVTICGLDEFIEFVICPEGSFTRVVRPQWSDRNIYGEESAADSGSGEFTPQGEAPEYTVECINGFLVKQRAVVSLDDQGLQQTEYVFEESLGIPCYTTSGSDPNSSGETGSGFSPVPLPVTGIEVEAVTEVCPVIAESLEVDDDHTIDPAVDTNVFVFAGAPGGNPDPQITLPTWRAGDIYNFYRTDSNPANSVSIVPATGSGNTINGGSSYQLPPVVGGSGPGGSTPSNTTTTIVAGPNPGEWIVLNYGGGDGSVTNNYTTTVQLLPADDDDGEPALGVPPPSQLPPGENTVQNGGFEVWQRGTSITLTTSGTYTADRWYQLQSATGSNTVYQRATGPTTSRYAMQFGPTAGSSRRTGVATIIESADSVAHRGCVSTLAFTAKASSALNLKFALLEWTGTADSVTKNVVNNWASSTYTPGNFFVASNVAVVAVGTLSCTTSFARAAITGVVSSACNNIIVFVWSESNITTSDSFTFSECALFHGGEPRLWVPRPLQQELALCQRYFLSYSATRLGIVLNTELLYSAGRIEFPVEMRTAPTLSSASYTTNAGSAGTPQAVVTTTKDTAMRNSASNWTVGAIIGFTGNWSAEL